MSMPEHVLEDLAQYKTIASEVPCFKEGVRCFVTAHLLKIDEQYSELNHLLFQVKRFEVACNDVANLPAAEEIDIPGMDNYIVDDLISLEMILRLWVPNIATIGHPQNHGLPIHEIASANESSELSTKVTS